MDQADEDFLDGIQVFRQFHDVTNPGLYRPLPPGWALALADIVGSTAAMEAGRYKAVNMAGAAVISSLSNSLKRYDLPFVFGGDGAAVAVPPQEISSAAVALSNVQRWAEDDLGLTMRVALVPVDDIRSHGHDVRVARFQASENVSYAMLSGGGNQWADAQMKAGLYSLPPAAKGARPDLTGLSCRFNPIKASHGKIVSVIAIPGPRQDLAAFNQLVLDIIGMTEQVGRQAHPVPESGPQLGYISEGLPLEARAGAGFGDRRGMLKRGARVFGEIMLVNVLGILNVNLGRFNAVNYRRTVASNTDFRKFDDGLKMTIDLTDDQLNILRERLAQAFAAGVCNYGLHEQNAALMTCIVPSPLSNDHMHFVDGAMGGYASAATQLKRQLQMAETIHPN